MQCFTRVWLAASSLASSLIITTGLAWAAETTHGYPECTTRPTENDVTAAKGAFQAGTVSFNEADYARAILYWEDAYRRDCTATLLLHHLGRAYEGAGNLEQAVIALRTYTERAPDSPERAQVLRRIEVFEQKIAEQKQPSAQATQLVGPAPTATSVSQRQQQNVAPVSSPPQVVHVTRPFPWAPVAVIAAGGVTALVGGLVYLKANSDISDVEKACGGTRDNCKPTSNLAEQGNEARTRAQIGTGIFYGGLAVAGAGVVWLILDSKKAPSTAGEMRQPALRPWLGTQGGGVAWSGSF
jgi:tetratricopeptide (TPR) repeat protein